MGGEISHEYDKKIVGIANCCWPTHFVARIVQCNILEIYIGTLSYNRVSCRQVVWYGLRLLKFCDLSICDVV